MASYKRMLKPYQPIKAAVLIFPEYIAAWTLPCLAVVILIASTIISLTIIIVGIIAGMNPWHANIINTEFLILYLQ